MRTNSTQSSNQTEQAAAHDHVHTCTAPCNAEHILLQTQSSVVLACAPRSGGSFAKTALCVSQMGGMLGMMHVSILHLFLAAGHCG